MSEEIDYAEMLEIPVATVNVVKKKSRHSKDLKEEAVESVNRRVQDQTESATPTQPIEEDKDKEFFERFAESERIETPPKENKKHFSLKGKSGTVLIVEFAAICLLCTVIFLTNIFMSNSAINTFLRSMMTGTQTSKAYSEFTLSGIVNEYADVDISVSSTGVLSFQAACCVYPACDGTISAVEQTDGLYTLKIKHSDSFQSVITGLTNVYYAQGDEVLSNVPIGYSDGEQTVNVTFYSNNDLLNCYSVDDTTNCLVWK